MTCEEFKKALFLLDSKIEQELIQEVETHTKSCPPCSEILTRLIESHVSKELHDYEERNKP